MSKKEALNKIKELNLNDLKAHLITSLKEQFKLRMQYHDGQLTNTSQLGKMKKTIAQIKTVMNKKLTQESNNE